MFTVNFEGIEVFMKPIKIERIVIPEFKEYLTSLQFRDSRISGKVWLCTYLNHKPEFRILSWCFVKVCQSLHSCW